MKWDDQITLKFKILKILIKQQTSFFAVIKVFEKLLFNNFLNYNLQFSFAFISNFIFEFQLFFLNSSQKFKF